MKLNYTGCAICDSTWGDVWAEIDGVRTFFCCELCVRQFRNLIARVTSETGWARVDSLEISGNRRGRACIARSGSDQLHVQFSFTPEGELLRFERVDSP